VKHTRLQQELVRVAQDLGGSAQSSSQVGATLQRVDLIMDGFGMHAIAIDVANVEVKAAWARVKNNPDGSLNVDGYSEDKEKEKVLKYTALCSMENLAGGSIHSDNGNTATAETLLAQSVPAGPVGRDQ
jgi:hypothetical protein